jgi:uncharacterized damage-inducible protein DinB
MPDTPLATATFADLDLELATTRRVLDRVPADRLDWRPHERSMTLGELATHIANLLRWWQMTLTTDGFDMSQARPPSDAPTTKDGILDLWDQNAAAVRELAAKTTDDDLNVTWTLRAGENVISTDPRYLVVRRFGMSHVVHHRGQLSVYLRLLDVPVPSIYGPSADEK